MGLRLGVQACPSLARLSGLLPFATTIVPTVDGAACSPGTETNLQGSPSLYLMEVVSRIPGESALVVSPSAHLAICFLVQSVWGLMFLIPVGWFFLALNLASFEEIGSQGKHGHREGCENPEA